MVRDIKHIARLLTLLTILLFPARSMAQFGFDVLSVEAFIHDHKEIKSKLLTRSAIEQVNMALHKVSKDNSVEYKAMNDSLDKYNKCFDIIDLIYTSSRTAFNAVNSYNSVKKNLGNLKELNEDFINKCLLKGNIVASDSLIINTYDDMVKSIVGDAEDLYKSFYDLALYASGQVHITVPQLMTIINNINDSLNHIRDSVDHCYYVLWKYITIRTTFWKSSLYAYNPRSKAEVVSEAMRRWRSSQVAAMSGSVERLSQKYPK